MKTVLSKYGTTFGKDPSIKNITGKFVRI